MINDQQQYYSLWNLSLFNHHSLTFISLSIYSYISLYLNIDMF